MCKPAKRKEVAQAAITSSVFSRAHPTSFPFLSPIVYSLQPSLEPRIFDPYFEFFHANDAMKSIEEARYAVQVVLR